MGKIKIPFKKGDVAKLFDKLIVIENINLVVTGPQVVFRFYNVNHKGLYFTELNLVTPLDQKTFKILFSNS